VKINLTFNLWKSITDFKTGIRESYRAILIGSHKMTKLCPNKIHRSFAAKLTSEFPSQRKEATFTATDKTKGISNQTNDSHQD
jgi:hypothetical protein